MKKIFYFFVVLTVIGAGAVQGKQVKFACDMTGIAIAPAGMHISGDFQTVAGFPGGDWNSASTPLTQEPGTDIYSIVVDIPAFTKYEYKFVNGDQFYEAEFVPEYSRVGYNFNDNRWIYVDSLANDTTFVGAIIFAENAPAGLELVRFHVDMTNETVDPSGVHVAGNFQGWDPATTILYSFGNNVYEMICYMPAGIYEYKFYNGNNTGVSEGIPSGCAVNGNREINVVDDVMVPLVCFGACDPCVTGIEEQSAVALKLAPNPAAEKSTMNFINPTDNAVVLIQDLRGKAVRRYENVSGTSLQIDKDGLRKGLYFIRVYHNNTVTASAKLVFN